MKQDDLIQLLDLGKQAAGSDYRLAKLTGITSQQISDWRHGRKSCPPEDQALIAQVAGLDPVVVLARAMVQKHEGTPKGERLLAVLGKALLPIGAALGTVGANAGPVFLGSVQAIPGTLYQLLHTIYQLSTRRNRRKTVYGA